MSEPDRPRPGFVSSGPPPWFFARSRWLPSAPFRLAFACLFALLITGISALAQEPAPPQEMKEIQQIQEDAKKLGDWGNQYGVIEDATDNVFQQQGWNSENDQYARNLMREVGRVSPWKPQEREKIFMDGLQERYLLTADQRTTLGGDIHRETMTVAMKHFKDTLPVAMEIIKTRANNQPFSAEQVQRWSKALKPVMDEGMTAMERVVGKLDKTMTEEQRVKLQGDLNAFRKRHQDMQKMVEKWQSGNWSPADWGLQNDPLHAGIIAQQNAAQAEKDRQVAAAQGNQGPDESGVATNESAWELYVRQFCDRFGCTDVQRTQADTVLKKHKKEALDYLASRREQIEKQRQLSQSPGNPSSKQQAVQELERLLTPVGGVFNRMKAQLMGLLTSEQRVKFPPPSATPSKPPAQPKPRPSAPPPAPAQPVTQPPAPSQPAAPQPTPPPSAPPPTTPPASQPAAAPGR